MAVRTGDEPKVLELLSIDKNLSEPLKKAYF